MEVFSRDIAGRARIYMRRNCIDMWPFWVNRIARLHRRSLSGRLRVMIQIGIDRPFESPIKTWNLERCEGQTSDEDCALGHRINEFQIDMQRKLLRFISEHHFLVISIQLCSLVPFNRHAVILSNPCFTKS